MPIKIRKVKNKKCYSVKSPKRVHSKCTTKIKAEAQKRIINQAENRNKK